MDEITWIAPDGDAVSLTDGENFMVTTRSGAFMPDVVLLEEIVPFQPGARLRSTRIGTREVDLTLVVRGDVRRNLRLLSRHLDPTRGAGRLRVRRDSGEARELICRYAGGLEGAEAEDASGPGWLRAVVTFRASDPFWYAVNAIEAEYSLGTPATFFPFFPLRLVSELVFADLVVQNPGDVEAWLVWSIRGPGLWPRLDNLTTGESLALSTALGGGETLIVDTRPGYKSIELWPARVNRFRDMSITSRLWALRPGDNRVMVSMNGATAESKIHLSFTPAYLSV